MGILLKVHGAKHPHVASSYNNLALIHLKTGDKPKAREYLINARSILMKTLGPGNIKISWIN
ncbi:MAG: tetratricopeptide repeat protein [Opitutae bacterium]|nr:tetratricopeptide repeat protein [Opitutae bacterium]